ncbi:response regulator [Steroidobacter cummioxidans]|uniref:response regulator n=1 Tax=Steroidobacter cummioxidans TaxID=1803913 RepID=UPI001379D892|nr:response regulator [Steroidobacter cummioxidans]
MSDVILVVDDDDSLRASTLRLLITRGYTAFSASSAAGALQQATALTPDVILMDLHLRNGSGLEAARDIKEKQSLAHIPIIALTATPPEWDEKLQLFAAVLVKPCPTAQILDAIETVLRR